MSDITPGNHLSCEYNYTLYKQKCSNLYIEGKQIISTIKYFSKKPKVIAATLLLFVTAMQNNRVSKVNVFCSLLKVKEEICDRNIIRFYNCVYSLPQIFSR